MSASKQRKRKRAWAFGLVIVLPHKSFQTAASDKVKADLVVKCPQRVSPWSLSSSLCVILLLLGRIFSLCDLLK